MRRAVLACVLVACAAPAERTAEQAVTNGAADPDDPAVIALVDDAARVGCTASAIGPHTAITAAHCIAGRDPRTLRVAFGTSVDAATLVAVSDGRVHPAFDADTLAHDVAMLTLRDSAPVAPLALASIDASLVGTSIRVVGFGTTGAGGTDSGTKRAGTARISDVQADELVADPDPSQPCHGDSGGPALLGTGAVAAVVSRGDAACADHAIYARIDVARAVLVDPYLAETAPGTAATGDACFYDDHCAEGPCLAAHDDPLLYFCSRACQRDGDCPAAMECAADACRYPEPSPGALGSPCDANAACTSGVCLQQVCTRSCLASADSCPADFACTGSGLAYYCFAKPGGCGGCSGSEGGGWLAVVIGLSFARGRRTGRSASPRDSRAARSR